MKRGTLVTLIIVVVLLAVGGAWLYRSRQQAAQAAAPDPGREVTVRRGRLVSTVRASGMIEPEAQVALNFGMPGAVETVATERFEEIVNMTD